MGEREYKLHLIRTAREAGMGDVEIPREVLKAEYGGNHRRKLVVEWGELLGLDASAALRKAHEAGLIPTVHPPQDDGG